MTLSGDHKRLRRLLDVARALVSELDLDTVLGRILEEACAITGARYAALGVLDENRTELERFVTKGVGEATQRAIGALPRGRGVLGVLIEDPAPLRLSDVGQHPQSYGFPPSHPEMHSFLGVPILIRGRAWGNLYLTEKQDGEEFTEYDENTVLVLAQWAGIAVDNARLYEHSERRRREAERAVTALEAARDIADAVGGIPDLDRVFELIVKRGRTLVGARTVLIMVRDQDELVVAAFAGHATDSRGRRLPISGSTSGQVLQRGRPERIADVRSELKVAVEHLGIGHARTALLVPLLHHGRPLGVLAAFDHGPEGREFTDEDEQLLRTFAASAANAVALNRSVEADRLRATIEAADAERARWARELHDETLQSLAGLRVLLAAALRRSEGAAMNAVARQAIGDIEQTIDNLRAIVSDLRPSLLDDLGLQPAIEALVERRRQGGLEIISDVSLGDVREKLSRDLETTIYRLIQEALTNVAKHSRASSVLVSLASRKDQLVVEVSDNGVGFDTSVPTKGFGLPGIRERVYLAGGTLQITSGGGGTTIRARLPVRADVDEPPLSAADQVAS